MKIDSRLGLVHEAAYIPSPNCDQRPPGTVIDLLVIHNISLPPGVFGGPWIEALFTNTLPPERHPYFSRIHGLRVSAHLLVQRNGAIVQYVPFSLRAWHAGTSSFAGRHHCNDFSIGVELEGSDDIAFEAVQYDALARVTRTVMDHYPAITRERIAGHCDIAPGRKTDPGPCFNWAHFHRLLDALETGGGRR